MTKKFLLITLACLFLFAFAGSALAVDTSNPCGFTYTPGYWKNHPEAWPAAVDYNAGPDFFGDSQASWLAILNTPPQGDAKIILARAWIAAYLNYLNGSYTGAGGEVTYLTDNAGLDLLNDPDASRDDLIEAAEFLDGYNNSNPEY